MTDAEKILDMIEKVNPEDNKALHAIIQAIEYKRAQKGDSDA